MEMCVHTETCTQIWPEVLFVTAENNPDIFQWVNCADLHHGIQLHHKRNELDSQNLPDESERCYRVRETSPSCLLPDSIQGEHHTIMENVSGCQGLRWREVFPKVMAGTIWG